MDKTYPDMPRLIPAGCDMLLSAFDHVLTYTIIYKSLPLVLPAACVQLLPRSEQHFRRTRELRFGKLEDWSPPGPVRDGHMKELQEAYARVAQWFEGDGIPKEFVTGKEMCYADLILAAWTMPIKQLMGEDSKEWQAIRTWDGGRWERLVNVAAKYYA